MEIPIIYEVSLDKNENSPHFEFPPRPPLGVASQHSSYTDPGEGFNFEKCTIEYFTPLKVMDHKLVEQDLFLLCFFTLS